LRTIGTEHGWKTIKRLFAVILFFVSASGCGGGGGSAPAASGGTPPTQAAWSPAKNSFINTSSPIVTFTTDSDASCRWALSDLAYDLMASACSGATSKSHSCSVSGLQEGAASLFISCAAADGPKDSASTNENISYTVDLTPPSLSITYPTAGAQFLNYTRPSYISVSYSDSGSGVSVTSLEASFTLQGRTIDISDLFGKDPAANASQSNTSAATSNPLARTTISSFTSSALDAPASSWTVPRAAAVTLKLLQVDDSRLLAWDSQGYSVRLLDASSGALSAFTPFSSKPLSAAVSGASNRFYAVFSGDPRLYVYSLSSGAQLAAVSLPGNPAELSYNSVLDRVYISFSAGPAGQRISVWKCAEEAFGAGIPLDHVPNKIAAWQSATDSVVTAFWAVDTHIYLVDSSGEKLIDAAIGDIEPGDLLADSASGFIFAAMYEDPGRVAAVNATSGAVTNIAVGRLPSLLFPGAPGEILSVSDGDGAVSVISTSSLSVSATAAPSAPVSDGLYLPGAGAYFLAEDVWKLPDRIPCTVSAAIQDAAGNTGTGQVTFQVAPGAFGGRVDENVMALEKRERQRR